MSAAAALLLLAASTPALTCGAVPRPGIAERGADGNWRGIAAGLCRKIAEHGGGRSASIAFHAYDTLPALRAATSDRVAFLSETEFAAPSLRAAMHAGPAIAVDRQVLVVHPASRLAATELGGNTVCFIIGTRAEAALNAWAERHRVPIRRLAFQEPAEMEDAFDVDRCAALALDAAETNERLGKVLSPALAEETVHVATPVAAGADWAATVARIVAAR